MNTHSPATGKTAPAGIAQSPTAEITTESLPLTSHLHQRTRVDPRGPHPSEVLALQRVMGNRMVQRLLHPKVGNELSETVQRSSDGGATSSLVTPDVERSIDQQRGHGRPLPKSLRKRFEGALGADFGGVRLHVGKQADTLSRSLEARAFTTGKDIFFKRGEYNTNSSGGQQTIAHELTHVVQQGAARSVAPTIQRIEDEWLKKILSDKKYKLIKSNNRLKHVLTLPEEAITSRLTIENVKFEEWLKTLPADDDVQGEEPKPQELKPTDTKPTETISTTTKSTTTKSTTIESTGAKPEIKPTESKPVAIKVAENTLEKIEPKETKPLAKKSAASNAPEKTALETKPVEPKALEKEQAQPKQTEKKPVQPTLTIKSSTQSQQGQKKAAQSKQTEKKPVQPTQSQKKSIKSTSKSNQQTSPKSGKTATQKSQPVKSDKPKFDPEAEKRYVAQQITNNFDKSIAPILAAFDTIDIADKEGVNDLLDFFITRILNRVINEPMLRNAGNLQKALVKLHGLLVVAWTENYKEIYTRITSIFEEIGKAISTTDSLSGDVGLGEQIGAGQGFVGQQQPQPEVNEHINQTIFDYLVKANFDPMTRSSEADEYTGMDVAIPWKRMAQYLKGYKAAGYNTTFEDECKEIIDALGPGPNPLHTKLLQCWNTIDGNVTNQNGSPSATIRLIEMLRAMLNHLMPVSEMVKKVPATAGCMHYFAINIPTAVSCCPMLIDLCTNNNLTSNILKIFHTQVGDNLFQLLKQFYDLGEGRMGANLSVLAKYGPLDLIITCMPEIVLLSKKAGLTATVFNEWSVTDAAPVVKQHLVTLTSYLGVVEFDLKQMAPFGPLPLLAACMPALVKLRLCGLNPKYMEEYNKSYTVLELSDHLNSIALFTQLPQVNFSEITQFGPLGMIATFLKLPDLQYRVTLNRISKFTGGKKLERLEDFFSLLQAQKDYTSFPQDIEECFKLLKYGSVDHLLTIWERFPDYDYKKLLVQVSTGWATLNLGNVSENGRLDVLYRKHLNRDPDTPKEAMGYELSQPDGEIGQALIKLIADIRTEQRDRKTNLEAKLTQDLISLAGKDNETLRNKRIQRHAKNLDAIGLSLARLRMDERFIHILQKYNLILDSDGKLRTNAQSSTVIGSLSSGENAYTLLQGANVGQGIHRDIYKKKGKPDHPKNNQYVKDDQDIMTRRYAYIEKNKYQFRDFVNTDSMQGRFPTDPSYQPAQPYNAITPKARREVPKLPHDKDTFDNPYQLAYLHQELGSGPEQRGVSAAATSKGVYSNQGMPFKSKDGVRYEVDLARIQKGSEDKLPNVINHYTQGAKAKSEKGAGNLYIDKGSHFRTFDHYQWSVRKNRELFLREVRPEHVTELTMHQTAANTSATVPQAGGFNHNTLGVAAQQVGVNHYSQGFADRIDNRGDDSSNPHTAIPVQHRPYYKEGRADAELYLTGRVEGAKRVSQNRDQNVYHLNNVLGKTEDADTRYRQGYWDAIYSRPSRRF